MLSFCTTSFSCMIDICLQIDLVLTLKRPLSNPRARQIFGISFSLLFACFMAVVIIATDFNARSVLLQVLFIGQRGFFFLSVLVSLGVTLHAYCKKGLSRQFRKLLMKRHISFCILTGVCQVV